MMRSAKKTYEIDMLHGAILPKLLRFAVPLTLSTMLQLLFNAADVVVVGRWAGDNSLAAVGSNTSLIALLTNMFLGLSIGANILAARHFGAHEDEELSKTVHTSILLSLYSGVFLTVIGILGARTILIWMQCPANVLDLATLYLRIYFAGMTATMLYNFGAALLRASGDTQRPLYYLFNPTPAARRPAPFCLTSCLPAASGRTGRRIPASRNFGQWRRGSPKWSPAAPRNPGAAGPRSPAPQTETRSRPGPECTRQQSECRQRR